MDYAQSARRIVDLVGGADNIAALTHCSTRLRLTLADYSCVNIDGLKAVPGVLGVVHKAQLQIIIGNTVVEMYDAVRAIPGVESADAAPPLPEKQRWSAVFIDFLIAVFQPLIPAIAGAGVLKSVMLLLKLLGWISDSSDTYVVLTAISDAVFYFLPLMVAVTTAQKLRSNILVALGAVSVLILPAVTTAMNSEAGLSVFGLGVRPITYSSQVFPAILSVLVLSMVERFFTKITPKPIRIFFVPMMTLLIMVPLTLTVLGPIGYEAGVYFTAAITWLFETVGWIAMPLLAVALPFAIAIGMHKALIPYAVSQMSATGFEALYLPVSLAHNIAESGACFGVALRTRDTDTRSTAISGGISALFGITEPALYGVTLQHKRALWSVLAGAAAGGIYIGITAVKAFVLVGPGLASMPMYIDADNPMNIVHAFIGGAIALLVALLVAALTWRDRDRPTSEANTPDAPLVSASPTSQNATEVVLAAPATGRLVALDQVDDPVFAGGAMGSGFAIDPNEGNFRAPVAGTVTMVFPTGHAVGITTDDGVEVLLHIGMDTVRLDGHGFAPNVVKGQHVDAGDTLVVADLEAITAAGYSPVTPVVVTRPKGVTMRMLAASDTVETGQPLVAATLSATPAVTA